MVLATQLASRDFSSNTAAATKAITRRPDADHPYPSAHDRGKRAGIQQSRADPHPRLWCTFPRALVTIRATKVSSNLEEVRRLTGLPAAGQNRRFSLIFPVIPCYGEFGAGGGSLRTASTATQSPRVRSLPMTCEKGGF